MVDLSKSLDGQPDTSIDATIDSLISLETSCNEIKKRYSLNNDMSSQEPLDQSG